MRRFWKLLLRKSLPPTALAGLQYAVFGLGDSGYVKYNVRVFVGVGACVLCQHHVGRVLNARPDSYGTPGSGAVPCMHPNATTTTTTTTTTITTTRLPPRSSTAACQRWVRARCWTLGWATTR
jgi:hypothetical protein